MGLEEIPGINPVQWREFRYIADDGTHKFLENGFRKLTNQVNPPIAKIGGVITENCKLWLPSGELFHALSYKGDIEGWRSQIEQGAKQLNLLTGKIVNQEIVLSDSRQYSLSLCRFEFY
ncbi:hypothetical protein ACHRVW_01155 [Flavobacterium collinsii]|uniref:hypothetical protein n=1 Tax=Flavobacterium collinsii TaxID=1114861 RepID=UPI003756794E